MATATKSKARTFQLCGQASHMVKGPSGLWYTCKQDGQVTTRDIRDDMLFEGLEQYVEVRNTGTEKEPVWEVLENQPGFVRQDLAPEKPKSYNIVGKDGHIRTVGDPNYVPSKAEIEAARQNSIAESKRLTEKLAETNPVARAAQQSAAPRTKPKAPTQRKPRPPTARATKGAKTAKGGTRKRKPRSKQSK